MGVDYSKLPKDLQDKLAAWEKNKPESKQLIALEDLSATLEQLVITLEQGQTAAEGDVKQLGALLADIRTSLASLEGKEAPESPDYASPVVGAVKDLEAALTKALAAVEVKPNINVAVPKIDAPQVNVSPPSVDLKGVEQVLRSDLPKAFAAAIASIPESPETDLSPLLAQLAQMSEQLSSIDTATRLKPQAPNSMKVTNADGSVVGSTGLIPVAFSRISFSNADGNGNYQTGTVKNGAATVGTLTFAYDGSSKLTDIQFT